MNTTTPYFATYVPDKIYPEISEGDVVRHPRYGLGRFNGRNPLGFISWTALWVMYGDAYRSLSYGKSEIEYVNCEKCDDLVKMKLHICTREVGIGDEVPEWGIIENEKISSFIFESGKCLPKNQCFKSIGEVSEDAKWVRYGHVFRKAEIQLKSTTNDRRVKHVIVGDPVFTKDDSLVNFERQGFVKEIKRKSTYAIDWDDIYVIERASILDYSEEKPKMVSIPDYEVMMRDVRFRPTEYKIAEIKCSNCGTFH